MRYMSLIAILALTAILPAAAQTTQKLSAGKVNEYGLIYTLPSTAVDVTLEAELTVETPGEFYLYSEKYLGVSPIVKASRSYRLLSARIDSHGIPTDSLRYLVQFKSGSTPYMLVDDNNAPLTINTESVVTIQAPALPKAKPLEQSILDKPVATQAVTADMLQSGSLAKRAQLAAERIMELRSMRSDILSGQADNMPSDGVAMQLVLDNIAAQEEALTAMFVGTRQKGTEVATFTVEPPLADAAGSPIVLCRLSQLDGFVGANDLSGSPIYIKFDVTSQGELPVNEKGEQKRFPKGGLAYRIPGKARVAVFDGSKEVAASTIDVAQYGVVFGLDPGLFTDKKAPAYGIFNPVTGAIVEIGTVN
ncbi:MAG: DUF4831 family protein [Paramuribaculum sp.]|nr:DUF4831 family protein [Paramuribaculum sp.]